MQSLLLNKFIKKYWVLENSRSESNRITDPMISDGCNEIMIIEGNGISLKTNNGEGIYRSGIYLIGQLIGKGEFCIHPSTKIHFLKLYPWTNPLLTEFSLVDLTNKCIPLSELNKSLNKKIKGYHPSTEITRIINVINQLLEDKSSTNSNFNIILGSCHKIFGIEQNFRIVKKNILSEFNISDRTLENKFKRHVGLTPKQFSMTINMRKVVEKLVYNRTDESLTTIALENGYFDQSHFIRSFKTLFNAAPSQLKLENYFIPDSNEPFRYYTI